MGERTTNDSGWGPRRLPVLCLEGRGYFLDPRLRELRAVDNPHTRIDLRSPAGREAVQAWKAIECPKCEQLRVVRRDDPAEVVRCPRCGEMLVVQGGMALAWSAPGYADPPT